ncbi:PERM-like protein [Mya arenaria]|uniref:PERM-like protein n=1 Tax=Mya arenaria TaxID=6604 RepID=A0ABY7ESE2_MYAAR|nr:PERM-like protein [Mya arenaria]
MQEIVREIVAMKNSSFSDITGNQEANTLFRSVAGDLCDPDVTCSNDIITSPYRTIDGSDRRSSPVQQVHCPPGSTESPAGQQHGSPGTDGQTDGQHIHHHGRLSVSGNKDLLPYAANDTCRLSVYGQHCFAAGDSRVNVVPNLSSHHIMFVRLHNQLADRLAGINPAWDDERLFQESRKLVIGIIQQFAYAEYLPAVLGNDIMERYRLNVQADGGHARVYDASIDATVFNAFNAAAFRFGHTTVPDLQESLKKSYASEYKTSIETTYNDPNMTYHHCDGVVRNFGVGIRDKLFPDAHNVSTDLAARNIQRGRDHGLPPYNRWRRHCGLSEITLGEFQAAGAVMGDFDVDTADSIRSVYEHPDDIDLFTGAIKERHLAKAQVGPLFACLLGTQFKRLKYGDRFYFENPSPAGGPDTGFSLGFFLL